MGISRRGKNNFFQGKVHKRETKEKIGKNSKKNWEDVSYRETIQKKLGEVYNSFSFKEKMRKVSKNLWRDFTYKKKVVDALKEIGKDPVFKERQKKINEEFFQTHLDIRETISKNAKERWKDCMFKERMSRKAKELWRDPIKIEKSSKEMKERYKDTVYKEKMIKASFEGLKLKPNKPEQLLIKLLDKLLPKEYKYVGDGKVLIEGKCPDFINVNGKKKIIEFFGDYFHSKDFAKRYSFKYESEQDRINFFKQYGYDTLIIWEKELSNLTNVTNKIINFHNR
ncbi:MAG: hypothetical protein WC942_08835 [Clostridia bacterium]|jgi:hypothetical protein